MVRPGIAGTIDGSNSHQRSRRVQVIKVRLYIKIFLGLLQLTRLTTSIKVLISYRLTVASIKPTIHVFFFISYISNFVSVDNIAHFKSQQKNDYVLNSVLILNLSTCNCKLCLKPIKLFEISVPMKCLN